jgi:hypothetical protein
MDEMSERNQNEKMADGVSLGEPSFFRPDDSDTFSPARIRRFSQAVLSAEAWFYTADELIAAMDLLEPHVGRFWDDVRSIAFAVDNTSDVPPKHETTDVSSKHSLINQHMMLAGFAIENLSKGYLTGRVSHKEREDVQRARVLPKSLKGHDILNLVEQTGMTLSDTERFLLERITDAVLWRGRYPSASSHERIRPFAQIGSDIRHIKTLLQKVRRHVGAKD